MARKRQSKAKGGARRCMTPGCQGTVFCRGTCKRCYRTYFRLVALGQTSWDSLVERGLVRDAYQTRKTPAMVAFEEAGLVEVKIPS